MSSGFAGSHWEATVLWDHQSVKGEAIASQAGDEGAERLVSVEAVGHR